MGRRNSIWKELVFIMTTGNKQMDANTYIALLLFDINWDSVMITVLYEHVSQKPRDDLLLVVWLANGSSIENITGLKGFLQKQKGRAKAFCLYHCSSELQLIAARDLNSHTSHAQIWAAKFLGQCKPAWQLKARVSVCRKWTPVNHEAFVAPRFVFSPRWCCLATLWQSLGTLMEAVNQWCDW